jgi:CBS domain-containing protein
MFEGLGAYLVFSFSSLDSPDATVMKIQDILTVKGSQVHTIAPDAALADVVQKLVAHNCGSLVVIEHERMVGIITERDILRACAGGCGELNELRVSDHMSSNLITGLPDDDVGEIMGLLTQHRIRHLPIQREGRLMGLISIGDVVKAQYDQLCTENHFLKEYIQS